jgi:hypothetical protein
MPCFSMMWKTICCFWFSDVLLSKLRFLIQCYGLIRLQYFFLKLRFAIPNYVFDCLSFRFPCKSGLMLIASNSQSVSVENQAVTYTFGVFLRSCLDQ